MKEQMSSPTAVSLDKKNKQVVVYTKFVQCTHTLHSTMCKNLFIDLKNCLCFIGFMEALLGDRGAQGPIWQPGADKYSRLDHQLQNANTQFIDEQQNQQQVLSHLISARQQSWQMHWSLIMLDHDVTNPL